MKTGNGLPAATDHGEGMYPRDEGRQLRDIEELVAKLRVVTKQLEFPMRTTPAASMAAAGGTAVATSDIAAGMAGQGKTSARSPARQPQAGHPGETAGS
jgi:hypothetical protein